MESGGRVLQSKGVNRGGRERRELLAFGQRTLLRPCSRPIVLRGGLLLPSRDVQSIGYCRRSRTGEKGRLDPTRKEGLLLVFNQICFDDKGKRLYTPIRSTAYRPAEISSYRALTREQSS
jgi:hypothetical protein